MYPAASPSVLPFIKQNDKLRDGRAKKYRVVGTITSTIQLCMLMHVPIIVLICSLNALDLHIGDTPQTTSIGMYNGYDYPYISCLCAIPTSSFNF